MCDSEAAGELRGEIVEEVLGQEMLFRVCSVDEVSGRLVIDLVIDLVILSPSPQQ